MIENNNIEVVCTKCKQPKKEADFPKRKEGKKTRFNTCYECINNRQKKIDEERRKERELYGFY